MIDELYNPKVSVETDDPDNIHVYRYARGGFVFVGARDNGVGENGYPCFSLDDSTSVALAIVHLAQGHEEVERVNDCSKCNALEAVIRAMR